jgi:hypothetical protein
MKKLISMILVIVMMLGVLGIQRAKAETSIYGNIYLFDTNIPFIADVLNWKITPSNITLELNTNTNITKAVGLTSMGEIVKIFIAIPFEKSYVSILYQGTIYNYSLSLSKAMICKHCIVFMFKGEINGSR